MIIQVLAGIREKCAAVIVAAIADLLHEEVKVRLDLWVAGIQSLEAPEKNRIGAKRIERVDRGVQISEQRDRRDDEHHDICRAQQLKRVLAILFEHALAELAVIFRSACANVVNIGQEDLPVKAIYKFIRQKVVTNGEIVFYHRLQIIDTKIAIDAIDNLFSDTSVSQDKARVNLENLIEEIHTMLESLEAAADDE